MSTEVLVSEKPADDTRKTAKKSVAIGQMAASVARSVIPPLMGLALFVLGWAILSHFRTELPSPLATWQAALVLFADPFYQNGPNDMGIGWNILYSLGRVGMGFGMAAALGIPLGFIIGRFAFVRDMFAPIISILRPVSPLAWLPIGLLVFKAAQPASGVSQVPPDYMNVARVLRLSEWKIFTKILLPATLPYLLTGIRLSIGVAWLVIVAAEMLTGGIGLGFWVWDEWNNLNVAHIIIAIFVVGLVGLLLEQGLILLTKMVSRGETTS